MPLFNRRDQHGDLFVEYNVVLPTDLTPQMRRSKPVYLDSPFRGCVLTLPAEFAEAFQSSSSNHDEL